MAGKLNDPPRPLLQTWRELNSGRKGEPSDLLKQMRTFAEQPHMREIRDRLSKFAETPHSREMREVLSRLRDSELPERLMGRMRPVSPPQPSKLKRTPGGGRKPTHTPEQIEEGIRLVRSRSKVSVDAACEALRKAGIKGGKTALYELIVKPAYASRS